jgi:hypothetical protein
MATKTTNNATPPDPSQVTFNPAALPPKLSSGVQYVGSQLQYVSPTGQILPVSAAPTTPTGSGTTTTPPVNPPINPPIPPVNPVNPLAKGTVVGTPQVIKNADGTITTVTTVADGNGGFTSSQTTSGTPTFTPSASDESAIGAITDVLGSAGLGSVAQTAWAQLNSGVPASQIISDIRSGNPIYGNAYAQRFPGMAALAAKGQAINEGTYINLEKSYTEVLKSAGIPSGTFDTTAYMGNLIANNINPTDLQARVTAAQNSVLSLDPNIRQYALDTYGLDSGHLAAWALDPSQALPKIQQQAQAMQIGGAALQQGFKGAGANGELTTAQAEALANQGISQSQAQAGFSNLAQETQFETQLPGDVATALSNQQLINSQFKSNGSDVLAFQHLQQQKVNEFNQGGAIAADSGGIKGIGASNLTA